MSGIISDNFGNRKLRYAVREGEGGRRVTYIILIFQRRVCVFEFFPANTFRVDIYGR